MYDRILLPTDGSDNAQLATDRAMDTATRHDAVLHVLYVEEKTRDDPVQTGPEEKLAKEKQTGRGVLGTVEDQAEPAGVETTTTLARGVPRTTIEDYTDEHDIDLVVIGSTGASDVSDKLLGTVSKYVVNEAPADVLVVRPDELLS